MLFPLTTVGRLILPARLRGAVLRLLRALPSSRRIAKDAERQIIEASLLFDWNWYLQKYPDVAGAGVDPISHYLTVGWLEGRDPGPAFTTSAYLKANEDVARAGVNPLLHFVQFGLAEGRNGFGDRHVPPSVRRKAEDLAPPHDCVSLLRAKATPPAWRRSYRLNRHDSRLLVVGETAAGYAPDRSSRVDFEEAVAWLRCLSGNGEGDLPAQGPNAADPGHRIVDAWYVNSSQLRTRWNGNELPLVVRAFQCVSGCEGEVRLVGEGVILSSTDFVDLTLLNPYFPILFAFAASNGILSGSLLLAFPSLCRGGTHYPELLSAASGRQHAPLDVAAVSDAFTNKLLPLLRMDAQAVVGRIEVDTAGSDGNGPLFRKDLQDWLTRVLRIGLPQAAPTGPRCDASATHQGTGWRSESGSLVLPADSAPTIGALVEHRMASGRQRTGRPAPLLASRMDPSGPVMLIDVPGVSGPALQPGGNHLPWLTPDASGLVPTDFPPAAIRPSSEQDLSDAELLVPISGACLATEGRPSITWLVQPDQWQDDQFEKGLQCFNLQRSSNGDALALIGPSATAAVGQARDYFSGAINAFRDESEALRHVRTPLIASVAGGVLLHDVRTADCLASMLSNDLISTASCVIVSVEKRAGVVKTVIVDGGSLLRADGRPAEAADGASVAAELWRGSWPTLAPSAYLWAARSRDMVSASPRYGEEPAAGAIHLCSSAVTAATLSRRTTLNNRHPEASDTSTRVEWLVG